MENIFKQDPVDLIRLLRNESLAAVAMREIERSILSGEYSANQKLKEEEIAARLNISRGPVREAFRTLNHAGLVRMEKNRSVTVREISIEEADETYELRAGLDYTIGRLAAKRATKEDFKKLKEVVAVMAEPANARDVEAYYPLNVQFHDLLAVSARNASLLKTYRQTIKKIHLFRRNTLALAHNSFPISVHEHNEILNVLSERDSERAGLLLYEHTMQSWKRMHEIIDTSTTQPNNK